MEPEFEFDEWFGLFQDKCRTLGYTGPIDKYSFEWNWEEGETPEDAAIQFLTEIEHLP